MIESLEPNITKLTKIKIMKSSLNVVSYGTTLFWESLRRKVSCWLHYQEQQLLLSTQMSIQFKFDTILWCP